MYDSLIHHGFNLMLYGMGTVFIFLTILIFATNNMSKIILRYFPEKIAPAAPPKRKKPATVSASSVSPTTLKIIHAAIEKHHNR